MKETGILLNPETNDLDIKVVKDRNGKIIQGLQVGDVTRQNTAIILYMQPGEMKEQPTVGVGINNMLLDHNALFYKHKIRQQLVADGMQVKRLNIKENKIELDANYK
jgi:hypothetical protein